MPPLASAAVAMASSSSHPISTPASSSASGVAFKLQTKSAVALVNERRIEFVRARNARAIARIDETTGNVITKSTKKQPEMLVDLAAIERVLSWKHSKKIGPGLANLGNTCYLNSVLQCLAYTPSFAQYLLQKEVLATYTGGGPTTTIHTASRKFMMLHKIHQHKHQGAPGGGFCGVRVMARLLQSVHGAGGAGAVPARVLQPKELVMNIRHVSKNFRIGRQEDSHEFFRLLLDAMQRTCLRKAHLKQESHPLASTTFIHRLFGGKLKNTLKCAKCQYVSERYDDFLDLSLEINNGISSVKGALRHFTATETLDDSNAWKCSSCQRLSRAEKGMTIDTCPNVLVVQLKRFDGMFGGKIKKHIEFGTTLDLAIGMNKAAVDRKRGRSRYELHAVLVHAGFSTDCGHYYAFVKGSSGQWYEMNDETVRWVSLETVLQQKAYMLFYSRVLPKESELPPPVATQPKTTEQATGVVVKEAETEARGVPVTKPVTAPQANGDKATKHELTMNGFLSSLRTELMAQKKVAAKAPAAVVTYTVSVPAKSRKRRLVPVFAGAVGRFARFHPMAWRPSAPLRMVTDESMEESTAETPKSPQMNGHTLVQPVVERVAFNPRELRNFGEKNAALYGKAVDTWGESGTLHPATTEEGSTAAPPSVETSLAAKHEQVLQKMKAEDWKHRKAQRKSSWDEQLDLGHTKKIKKREEFVANEGNANAFQLALLQKKQKQF